jgi:peptidoglycan/xylan/chitin deacetylase (PgdA/CDA1 family)
VNRAENARQACFSVDLEQDRAPDTTGWRGMAEGLPRILKLLADLEIRATFFATGESARRFPTAMQEIVAAGHELGSHGDQHLHFDRIDLERARRDIGQSLEALSKFSDRVTSFRAPYLRLPRPYLALLTEVGLRVDSSEGRYKSLTATARLEGSLARIPASLTSEMLHWPGPARAWLLKRFARPLVLFVHPWEFVDFVPGEVRRSRRSRPFWPPNARALPRVRQALVGLRERGLEFMPLRELVQRRFGPQLPS